MKIKKKLGEENGGVARRKRGGKCKRSDLTSFTASHTG